MSFHGHKIDSEIKFGHLQARLDFQQNFFREFNISRNDIKNIKISGRNQLIKVKFFQNSDSTELNISFIDSETRPITKSRLGEELILRKIYLTEIFARFLIHFQNLHLIEPDQDHYHSPGQWK